MLESHLVANCDDGDDDEAREKPTTHRRRIEY